MVKTYILFSVLCFLSCCLRTVYDLFMYRKHPIAENKRVIVTIYVVMGILWFSWFQMCFFDPVKIDIPPLLRYAGLFLFVCGVLLFIFSHMKLGGFTGKGGLMTGGIYSKIRNPMYLGFILWIIGFPVFMRSTITMVSSALWIAFIISWKILEEKDLERKYPEYTEYKRKTWF